MNIKIFWAGEMTTIEIVEMLRARFNCKKYWEVAQYLYVSPQLITSYKNRNVIMSDKVALRAAKLLEIPAHEILVSIALERAERAGEEQLAAAWKAAQDVLIDVNRKKNIKKSKNLDEKPVRDYKKHNAGYITT